MKYFKSIFVYTLFLTIAIFFSIKVPTDYTIVYWSELKLSDICLLVVIFLLGSIFTVLCNYGLDYSEKYFMDRQCGGVSKYFKMASFCFAFFFLSWVVFFLAFYPGNLSPDSYASISQAFTYIQSNAHPVLFTLLVKVCMKAGLWIFGNMNAAVATYSIVQMLLLDGILTYTVVWLAKHEIPKLFLIFTIAYFAFHPLIVRFSFTMWKDVLFSGVILLLVLFLYDLATDPKTTLKKNGALAHFLTLSVLAAFLRNRIVYAVLLIFLIIIILQKENRKKLILAFSLTGFAILIIQGPVYNVLQIRQSNFAESQGVSLQQLAAVVVENGKMSEEEAKFISNIIPLEDIPKVYNASTVDTLKGYSSFNHEFLNAHSAEYVKVWKSIIMKNPGVSIKAWLRTTRGFWGFNVWIDPFAITWPSERWDIYQVNIIEECLGADLSYWSNGILLNIEKVPFVRRLFELGSLGWFGVFCCARQIQKKRYQVLFALIPLNALWVVLVLTTPIFFQARYMFAYHLALPVLVCLLLMGDKLRKKDEQ